MEIDHSALENLGCARVDTFPDSEFRFIFIGVQGAFPIGGTNTPGPKVQEGGQLLPPSTQLVFFLFNFSPMFTNALHERILIGFIIKMKV